MKEQEQVNSYPKFVFTSTILVPVSGRLKEISVQADDYVVSRIGGEGNPQLVQAYLHLFANKMLEWNWVLGIRNDGIKKISIHHNLLPHAKVLASFNQELLQQLRGKPHSINPLAGSGAYISFEDESCLCSWCLPIEDCVGEGL